MNILVDKEKTNEPNSRGKVNVNKGGPFNTTANVNMKDEIFSNDDSASFDKYSKENKQESDEQIGPVNMKSKSPKKMSNSMKNSSKSNQNEENKENHLKYLQHDGKCGYFQGSNMVDPAEEKPIASSSIRSPQKTNSIFIEAFMNPKKSPQHSVSYRQSKVSQESNKPKTVANYLITKDSENTPLETSNDISNGNDGFKQKGLLGKNSSDELSIIKEELKSSQTKAILRRGAMKEHTDIGWSNGKSGKSNIKQNNKPQIYSLTSKSPSAVITRTDAFGNIETEAFFADDNDNFSKFDIPDTSADFDARMKMMKAAYIAGSSTSNSPSRSPISDWSKFNPPVKNILDPKQTEFNKRIFEDQTIDNENKIQPDLKPTDLQEEYKDERKEEQNLSKNLEDLNCQKDEEESDIPMPKEDPNNPAYISESENYSMDEEVSSEFKESKQNNIKNSHKVINKIIRPGDEKVGERESWTSEEEFQNIENQLQKLTENHHPKIKTNREPKSLELKQEKPTKDEVDQLCESPIPEKAVKLEIPETPTSPFEQKVENEIRMLRRPGSVSSSPTLISFSSPAPSPEILKQLVPPLAVNVEEERQLNENDAHLSHHISQETPNSDLPIPGNDSDTEFEKPKTRKRSIEDKELEENEEKIIPIGLRREPRFPVQPHFFNEDEFAFREDTVLEKNESRSKLKQKAPFQFMEKFPRQCLTDDAGNNIFPGISLGHSHIERVVVSPGNMITAVPARSRLLLHVLKGSGRIRRGKKSYSMGAGSEAAVVKNDKVEIVNNQKAEKLEMLFVHI